MNGPLTPWLEAAVAALMIVSGLLSLVAALGILRLEEFFQRLHPPALANTLGCWCACVASIAYLSAAEGRPMLYPLVLNMLLAITAPITTSLLARAALFRGRLAGGELPPPLQQRRAEQGHRDPGDARAQKQ